MTRKIVLWAFGALTLMGVGVFVLHAVDVAGVFELDDADATDNPNVAGEDWQTVNAPGYVADGINGHAVAVTGVVQDMHPGVPADPTAFFSKQTKDTVDIPNNWTYKATSVPDKDDIDNAYAAAYIPTSGPDAGHLIITFGADRFSAGNGDAFLGFWFFQENVAPIPTSSGVGTFSGHHVAGDILVLVNFQGGGSTPNIQVLKWVDSGGDIAPNLLQVFLGQSVCGPNHTGPACAITNTAPIDVYWPFDYKNTPFCDASSGTCSVPALAFFEGGVDLTELLPAGTPCITSFLAETRSSSSVTADLKDFVSHSFQLCGIGIDKQCGTAEAQGDTIAYTNTITVSNTGSGTLYDAFVTDTYQTGVGTTGTQYFAGSQASCVGFAPCTVVAGLAQLEPKGQNGSSVNITESYNSTLLTATNNATVEAAPSAGAHRSVHPDQDASATCKIDIVSDVLVSKNCDKVELVPGSSGGLVVKVTVSGTIQNNSSSDTDIVIDSISDNPAVASIPLGKTTLAQNESTTFGPFSYFPDAVSLATCQLGTKCFTDVVTVNWHAVLGGATGSDTGQADCPLCPAAQCLASTSAAPAKLQVRK